MEVLLDRCLNMNIVTQEVLVAWSLTLKVNCNQTIELVQVLQRVNMSVKNDD